MMSQSFHGGDFVMILCKAFRETFSFPLNPARKRCRCLPVLFPLRGAENSSALELAGEEVHQKMRLPPGTGNDVSICYDGLCGCGTGGSVLPDPLASSEYPSGLWISHFTTSPVLSVFLILPNQPWPGEPPSW